ncbi:DUF2062 domain-containing protein [Salinarimonas chemoclinalis]|uniref:DUF2062 domain-containing protein n=1 Tax=Salinarimonas chemoclinalis TaxID=3241599 RepID=UPI003556933C
MFGRRNRPSRVQRIKTFLWPERGFRRSGRYVVARLSRLKTSPHAIAAGFASGAAVSFTPLLGLHFFLAFVLAFLTRGSMIAAAFGTVVGNPVTFPLIFAASYWLGTVITSLATSAPQDAFEVVAEGFEEGAEAQAEAAADAVLDTAETFLEQGWSFAALEYVWPTLSTMLIGAVPMAILAWLVSYALVRAGLGAYAATRRGRGPRA